MNVLGIDYGTEHIGLAIGSTESNFAEPLITISTSQNPSAVLQSLIPKHHITALVVGISEKTSAEQATQFSDSLKEILKLPVYLIDETFSSKEATSQLFHKSREKRTSAQHATAAAIILERWMEESRS